jgi:trehalose/maltose hydrolase-like predicted phosphorylase
VSADTGLREIHNSGDISFAVWQYFRATKDMSWLKQIGWPLLKGIADFWVSRSTDDAAGRRCINDVIPPDEYHDHVNNSVYTNVIAQLSLDLATRTANMLGQPADPKWADVSKRLPILFDPVLNIHPEFEGYKGAIIKQADVILLGFPIGQDFIKITPDVREAELEYYGARTDNAGPAMTWGMQAVGYIELQQWATAASNFNRSFANVQAPFGVVCNIIFHFLRSFH